MSGLSYICDYGDSDDEYDTAECQEKVIDCTIELKREKLPPPNLKHIPVVTLEQHIDDPAEHCGRIRSFPHVRGNWSTFVYIQYTNNQLLTNIIEKLQAVLSIDKVCQKCEDFHISLSKTFVLKYHMISLFTKSLQEVLNNIDSFELGFESVAVYCNEEKTRTFIALKVDVFAKKDLLNIAAKVDTVLSDFRLPTFYEDPSFHMSILDINGNKKAEVLSVLEDLNTIFLQEESKNKITAFAATQNIQRRIYINPNFMPVNKNSNIQYINPAMLHQNVIHSEVAQNTKETFNWNAAFDYNSDTTSQNQHIETLNSHLPRDRLWTETEERFRHTNETLQDKSNFKTIPLVKSRYCLVNNSSKSQTTVNVTQMQDQPGMNLQSVINTNTFKSKGPTKSKYVLVRKNEVDSPKIKPLVKNRTIKVSKYKMVDVDSFKRSFQLHKCNAMIKPLSVVKSDLASPTTSKNYVVTTPTSHTRSNLKAAPQRYNCRHSNFDAKVIKRHSISAYQTKTIHKRSFKINNIPCPLYSKYGKCLRKDKASCEYLHDKKHISLCRKFVKGICHDNNCLLSHELSDKKMPTCYFYLKGMCTKEQCPYVHIKLSEKTKLCQDFLKGYCEMGHKCLLRHVNKTHSLSKIKSSLNKSDRKSPKLTKCSKSNFKPLPKKRSQDSVSDKVNKVENEKDCRYYRDIADSDDDKNCEIIKTNRCKLGTLPSFIQL